MITQRLLGAAAVAALLSGPVFAQTPAAPAETTRPASVAPTPPVTTPDTPAAPASWAPPASSIVAPPATHPTPVAVAPGQLVARGDIVATLQADGHFKTFLKALETANMTNVLKTNRNLTVFAPTDAAFAALPAGELDRLMKSPAEIQKLLTYHVINATVDSAKIRGARGGVKTVAGPDLILDGSGAALMANTATITQSDVKATNGTVHVVDKVLSPASAPTMAAATVAGADAPAPPPTDTPPAEPEVPKTPDTPVDPQS